MLLQSHPAAVGSEHPKEDQRSHTCSWKPSMYGVRETVEWVWGPGYARKICVNYCIGGQVYQDAKNFSDRIIIWINLFQISGKQVFKRHMKWWFFLMPPHSQNVLICYFIESLQQTCVRLVCYVHFLKDKIKNKGSSPCLGAKWGWDLWKLCFFPGPFMLPQKPYWLLPARHK